MELSEFLRKVKGKIIMQDRERKTKEIIIKGIAPKDTKAGPSLGIVDREGNWYNVLKSVAKDSWADLNSLKQGERVNIAYSPRSYKRQDGSTGWANDLIELNRVLQPGDEVVPVEQEGPVNTTSPVKMAQRQEMSPKQTCVKSATDLFIALFNCSPVSFSGVDKVVYIMDTAKVMYAILQENW